MCSTIIFYSDVLLDLINNEDVDDDVVVSPVVLHPDVVAAAAGLDVGVVIVVDVDIRRQETNLLRPIKNGTSFLLKRARLPNLLTQSLHALTFSLAKKFPSVLIFQEPKNYVYKKTPR